MWFTSIVGACTQLCLTSICSQMCFKVCFINIYSDFRRYIRLLGLFWLIKKSNCIHCSRDKCSSTATFNRSTTSTTAKLKQKIGVLVCHSLTTVTSFKTGHLFGIGLSKQPINSIYSKFSLKT